MDPKNVAANYHTLKSSDGPERDFAFRRLSKVPMIVVVGVSTEENLGGWYSEMYQAIILSLCFLGLSFISGFLLLRLFSRADIRESTLREGEARLNDAQRIAKLGSFEWNLVSNTMRWSDEFFRLWGVPLNAVPSYQLFLDKIHPEDVHDIDNIIKSTLENSDSYTIEHRIVWEDGSEHFVLGQGTIIRDTQGVPIQMQGAALNISQRKRLELDLHALNSSLEERITSRTHELEQSNKELQTTVQTLQVAQHELVRREKLAALGSLVAGIAHELNTPTGNSLTVASTMEAQITEFAELTSKNLTRTGLQHFIANMQEGVEILLRSLDRSVALVSSFKQVAVDQTSEHRRQFDLGKMTAEVLMILSPTLKKTNYTIINDIPADIIIDSYPGPFGQVLTNLVNNACIHGLDGRMDGVVTIKAEKFTTGCIQVTVIDNGCGIAPVHLGKVFDPFFTTKLGHGGSGLGLNIVYNIVTNTLGGTIRVESVQGEGTAFILELPSTAPYMSPQEDSK